MMWVNEQFDTESPDTFGENGVNIMKIMNTVKDKIISPPDFRGGYISKYILWKRIAIGLIVVILCGILLLSFVLVKSNFIDNAGRKLGIVDYNVSGRESYVIKGWAKSIRNEQADIVFLGDSITYGGEWDEYFKDLNVYSIAVPGDSVEEILCKVDMVSSLKPEKIFIMVGTNNISRIGYGNTISQKYEELIIELQNKTSARIFIQSVLPVREPSGLSNTRIDKANDIIKNIAERYSCVYVNLHDEFSNENGELQLEYSSDGCHINESGYIKWVSIIYDLIYD